MIAWDLVGWSMLATFIYVATRALQQLNVVHGHYVRVLPTSIAMGVGDVVLFMLILKTQTVWLGVANGLAGACGCYVAMYFTKRLK